jgi:hypothetical protein
MLTSPRRRSRKLSKLETLETRNLLASGTVGSMALPLPISPPAMVMPPPNPPGAIPASGPKVSSVRFEPLTGRVLVAFAGDTAGYNNATLTNPANYSFKLLQPFTSIPSTPQSRPKAGVVLQPELRITGVALPTPVAPGMVQTVVVTVNNNQPLRDGIYQFTIFGAGITDKVGQHLDGAYSGVFPSGDGQPGSNFTANFEETKHSVSPAMPLASEITPMPTPGVPPAQVFVPTTSPVRVGYTSATPGQFMLAGGNQIALYTIPRDIFPESTPRVSALHARSKAK